MASSPAKVVRGKNLLLKVSDGGGTPTYAHPCSINAARGIQFTANTNDVRVPDCTNPELIAWMKREKVSLSASVNGTGKLHSTDLAIFQEWFESEDPVNCKIEFSGVTLANGGGWWQGDFHLTEFGVSGDLGDYVDVSITLQSDGAVTWHDAAA